MAYKAERTLCLPTFPASFNALYMLAWLKHMSFERSIDICILGWNKGTLKIFTDLKETLISGKSERELAILFKSHIYQTDVKPMNLIDVLWHSFHCFSLLFFLCLPCLLSLREIISPKDPKMKNKKYYVRTPLVVHTWLVLFFLLIFLHAVLTLSWNTVCMLLIMESTISPTASLYWGQMLCVVTFIIMVSWDHLMRGPVEHLVSSNWW